MQIKIQSPSELKEVAKKIFLAHPSNKIFLLKGDMGAGKTSLVKELCLELGVQDHISSPTYSIVNEYMGNSNPIYHFDFYRLENTKEAFNIGAEDYFFSNNYCFIEWPDLVINLLPSSDKYVCIDIFVEEDFRTFQF